MPRLLSRALSVAALALLLTACDSGDSGGDPPPGRLTSGQYTATFGYAADGSQDEGLPTEGTGTLTFRTDDVLSSSGFTGSGTATLSLGANRLSSPSMTVAVTPAGSGFDVAITAGANLSVTGTGDLIDAGQTMVLSPARVVASAYVGLETGTNASLRFTFRPDE